MHLIYIYGALNSKIFFVNSIFLQIAFYFLVLYKRMLVRTEDLNEALFKGTEKRVFIILEMLFQDYGLDVFARVWFFSFDSLCACWNITNSSCSRLFKSNKASTLLKRHKNLCKTYSDLPTVRVLTHMAQFSAFQVSNFYLCCDAVSSTKVSTFSWKTFSSSRPFLPFQIQEFESLRV